MDGWMDGCNECVQAVPSPVMLFHQAVFGLPGSSSTFGVMDAGVGVDGGAGLLLLLLLQVSGVLLFVMGITFCGGALAPPLEGHGAVPMAALGHHSSPTVGFLWQL